MVVEFKCLRCQHTELKVTYSKAILNSDGELVRNVMFDSNGHPVISHGISFYDTTFVCNCCITDHDASIMVPIRLITDLEKYNLLKNNSSDTDKVIEKDNLESVTTT